MSKETNKDEKFKLELRGRLWLWSCTLDECHRILSIAKRAEKEMDSQQSRDKQQRFVNAQFEFAKRQPDYIEGNLKDTHMAAFQKIQQMEFPAYTDCVQIVNYCQMLAVIFFCQLFNSGYADEGKVAGNTPSFIQSHFNNIVKMVFPSQEAQIEFHSFKDNCVNARNKMLGHAQGVAFNVAHGDPISTMTLHVSAVRNIDFNYMRAIVGPMSNAIMAYERQVTEEI